MAAFDPIEFFGVGHGRDIIIQHGKSRSQSSISLSSCGSPSCNATEKTSELAHSLPFPPDPTTREPWSPSHSFTNITPEDSVYGPSLRVGQHSPLSPNVSTNSSWTSTPDLPTALHRYIGTDERHEQMALSWEFRAPGGGAPATAGSHAAAALSPRALEKRSPNSSLSHSLGDSPMRRFVADIPQKHEELAIALEKPVATQTRSIERQASPSPPSAPQETDTSMILKGGEIPAEAEDHDASSLQAVLDDIHRQKHEKALAHPRTLGTARLRKNRSTSVSPGPKSKKVKRE